MGAQAWTAEALALRELAARARTAEVAASLMRSAEAADAMAAWWRSGEP